VKSELDTISLHVNTSDATKLKFLIHKGAEISIIRGYSLDPEVKYVLNKSIDIKGICNAVLKTAGSVELKLLTATHESSHLFHVLEEPSALQYDGIL